jgi:Zn-finger nucleic acid-binding protein
MKCPVCKTIELVSNEIEPNLTASVCENCNGKWITANDYSSWRSFQSENLPVKPPTELRAELTEFEMARLCPKCKRILLKYKAGYETGFMLDRCNDCGGMWFDRDEWETLKERNLHDDLQEIFLDSWQQDVRRKEAQKRLEQIYQEKFGAEDYDKIKTFKDWLDSHERKNEIRAFLNDDKPFEV